MAEAGKLGGVRENSWFSLKKIVDRAATLDRCKKDAEGNTRKSGSDFRTLSSILTRIYAGSAFVRHSLLALHTVSLLSFAKCIFFNNYRLHLCT